MLTRFSLGQVNAALGTNLTQEKYDDRIRILRETEAFAREACVGSTAVADGGASSPAATESTSTRGREETESCHSGSDRVWAAQKVSPLHLLADVAGREHVQRRSTGAVPTLGPVEPISGSPGSAENAASPSRPDLFVGGGVGSMEQPSAGGHGLVTLSDGSCLPIGCLEGPAPNPGHASGIDTDGQGGTNGIGLGIPLGRGGPTISDRPAKRQRVGREADGLCHGDPGRNSAVEHAAGQDDGQDEDEEIGGDSAQEEEVDLLMHEFLRLDSENS